MQKNSRQSKEGRGQFSSLFQEKFVVLNKYISFIKKAELIISSISEMERKNIHSYLRYSFLNEVRYSSTTCLLLLSRKIFIYNIRQSTKIKLTEETFTRSAFVTLVKLLILSSNLFHDFIYSRWVSKFRVFSRETIRLTHE